MVNLQSFIVALYGKCTRAVTFESWYQESISLAAVDVDIIGVGERANILIESVSKPVLSFRAVKGVVRNLTLRQTGGGCDSSVDISAGALLLENCDLSGQGDAVVRIHNAGTRAQAHFIISKVLSMVTLYGKFTRALTFCEICCPNPLRPHAPAAQGQHHPWQHRGRGGGELISDAPDLQQ